MPQISKYLDIRRKDELHDFERYLTLENIDTRILRLPTNIREGGSLGGAAALTQLVNTWQNQSTSCILQTYLKPDAESSHEKFIFGLPSLAATYYAHQVFGLDTSDNIRQKLLAAAKPRVQAMANRRLRETSKGQKVEFLFFVGAKNEFHNTFYTRQPESSDLGDRQRHGQLISSPAEMNLLLEDCLKAIGARKRNKQWDILRKYLTMSNKPLGTAVHEIFRNTAEHGYLDVHAVKPSKGLRCFLLGLYQVSRDHLAEPKLLSITRPPAVRYFQDLSRSFHERAGKNITFLELSILDSGPGFAATMSDHAAGNNRELVANCFRKHQTAKPGRASGVGLFRVLAAVNELGGFIRVRTSTAEAFYASSSEYWPTMDPISYTEDDLPNVTGSLITLGIPVTR